MSETGESRAFDDMAKEQLAIYAKELQQLHAETSRLRTKLAEADQRVEQAGRVGRYTLGERIGHGGTAVVYKGLDPELGREVAIKVLHSYFIEEPRFLQRFRNEAATAAKLTHPNILHVYDFGETEGSVYIVTNYLPGGTLDDRFGGRLTTAEVMEFASPIASALDYAHERSVVHRDLKPGNILLDTDGTPILADFGIAKVLGEGVGPTLTKWTVGTPEYMSPEQALGQAVDHRSDIYSFGVLVYQALLGRLPITGQTQVGTLLAHVRGSITRPSAVDPQIDRDTETVLMKALAATPDERFQKATEFIESLAAAA